MFSFIGIVVKYFMDTTSELNLTKACA